MESLSDIVAQMRGRGEDGRVDRHLWNEYADRIEAACMRACNEIDSALCSIEGATGCDIAAVRAALDNTIGECYE